jgi:acyl carrier protein phosphodiesterase
MACLAQIEDSDAADENVDELPFSSHRALQLMAKEDWLSSYAQIDEIADVLLRMSRRARQPNPLANGEQEFLADVDGFTNDFHEWLDDTKEFCRSRQVK